MARKDPFPNEWDDVSNTEPEDFETATFEEVMQDLARWYLPDPYFCVIRSFNRKLNKLREFAYKQEGKATQRLLQLSADGEEVTIYTQGVLGVVNYEPD